MPRQQPQHTAAVIIPDGVEFSALKISRDPATGDVDFDWAPILAICQASGIDPAMFRDADEGNVSGLISRWYAQHLAAGGSRDAAMDELIAEARAEDAHGGGFSHQPGRA